MNTGHSASGLRIDAIDLALDVQSHAGFLRRLGALSTRLDDQIDPVEAMTAFMTRERLGSIVLAERVALPHAVLDGLSEPVVSVARSIKPVRFEEGYVSLAIGILVPEDAAQKHLKILRFWASLLRLERCRHALLAAPTSEHFYKLVKDHACSP